ncbi:hypothetical protein LWI29_002331 [Acer saccharum]|uniref:DUF4283 domain-containing protein n=1 Tax=Acer saccharum TaxID=4024 RepID=A0AA39SLY2_ACESA|nr:hypothetical protein LWI29_002331 [Acer saccharum]
MDSGKAGVNSEDIVSRSDSNVTAAQIEEGEVNGEESRGIIKCKSVVEESCEPNDLGNREMIIGFQFSPTSREFSDGPQPIDILGATPPDGPQSIFQTSSPTSGKPVLNFNDHLVMDLHGPDKEAKITEPDVAKHDWNNRRKVFKRPVDIKEVQEDRRGDYGNVSSDNRSFAEVVEGRKKGMVANRGSEGGNICSMNWKDKQESFDWLDRCAVGVLRNFSSMASVNRKLTNRGFCFSSAYLGDKCVVWEFESRIDYDDFIRNHYIWKECFSLMVHWTDSVIPKSRLVWLNCVGISLQCWSESFFRKVGWTLGEPLVVDNEIVMRCRLEKGRLLALIPVGAIVPSKIKVLENNQSFEFWIFEDPIPVNQSWLMKHLDLKKKSGIDSSNLNYNPVLNNPVGAEVIDPNLAEKGGKFCAEQPYLFDNMDGRQGEDMGNCNQCRVRLRKDNTSYFTLKGKGKIMLSRKSKSRPQYQGMGFGSIILEKRNLGEKVSESSNSDSLSSSDLGTLRGECSTRNKYKLGNLGRISHSAIGLKPGQLFMDLGPLQNASGCLVLDQKPDPLITSYKDNSMDGNMNLLTGSKECVEVLADKELSG